MPQETPASSKKEKEHKRKRAAGVEQEPGKPEAEAASQKKKNKKKDEGEAEDINIFPSWANLDLVLSLQSKDRPIDSKIQTAFDFVTSIGERPPEPLRMERSAAFLGDWLQHCMIASCRSDQGSESTEICSDVRCWLVLKFCLEKSSFRISANVLRPIGSAVSRAALWLETGDFTQKDEFLRLYSVLSECLSLLFTSRGRAVNNAGVELWVSCAVNAVGLCRKFFSGGGVGRFISDVFPRLSLLILEQFSNFLRFHPNPRNVFRLFVDRLLDPLLELVVVLRELMGGGDDGLEGELVATLNAVLTNGLFHPSHMSGFLDSKSFNVRPVGDEKVFQGSYHRHLFHKVQKIVSENRGLAMAGFGELFGFFVTRVKNVRDDHVSSKSAHGSGKYSDVTEMVQESNQPIFEVFVHFMEPLLFECKKFVEGDLSKVGKTATTFNLSESLYVVTSVNTILAKMMHEKVYTRMKDTAEGEHYKFLKEVYDVINSISQKLYKLSLSELNAVKSEDIKVLALMATELVVSIGYLLEIEYKIIGDNLVVAWLMVLSNLVVSYLSTDPKSCSFMRSKVLHAGCQIIRLYSELRQVDSPIFSLCKAMRLFFSGENGEADFVLFPSGGSLSSRTCAEAAAALLLSQPFKIAISNAIKFIPEGQASVFIEQLKEDVGVSLEWIRKYALRFEGNDLTDISANDGKRDLSLQLELLSMLSELYAIILDSLPVKTSNSNSVGHAVENVLSIIRPGLASFVDHSADGADGFLFMAMGIKSPKQGLPVSRTCASAKVGYSWLLMFLFRIYSSCRSLYNQVISLMPRNRKKAAATIGSMFLVAHGESRMKTDFAGNYFTWITASCVSLPAVIETVTSVFLEESVTGYAPFVYLLLTMAFQRLVELNRQLQGFEFLEEKLRRSSHFRAVDDVHSLHADDNELCGLLDMLRKEAVDLTNIMTGYLSSVTSVEDIYSWNSESIDKDIQTWDFGVCSLNEKTLPIAIWYLLCKNIDVWCRHAASRIIKRFISLVIYHALPYKLNSCNIVNKEKTKSCLHEVTMHQISSGLLMDTFFYEQMAMSRHFMSRFLRCLKKSLSALISHANTSGSDSDFSSLPDWSEALSTLENLSFVHDVEHASIGGNRKCPHDMDLETCHCLIDLLCRVIKVHTNARSTKSIAAYVLNIERILILTLCNDDSSMFNHFTLLKLLVSCRRCLRYLAVASFEGNMFNEQSPFEIIISENPLSVFWLLKSVSVVVTLPCCYFGLENSHETKRFFFSLIDHTSYLFFELTKGLIIASIRSSKGDEIASGEHALNAKVGAHAASGNSSASSAGAYNNAWKQFEVVAEFLTTNSEYLRKFCTDGMLSSSLEFGNASANCNKILCLISCIQGFLSGLASALSTRDLKEFKGSALTSMQSFGSKINGYVSIFNGSVNMCLTTLFGDDRSIESSDRPDISMECCQEHDSMKEELPASVADSLGNDGSSHSYSKQLDVSMVFADDEGENSFDHCAEGSTVHRRAADLLISIPSLDLLKLQNKERVFLQSLLKGELSEMAFLVRQLFISSSAVLHLNSTPLSRFWRWNSNHVQSSLANILVATSYHVLQEMGNMIQISDNVCYTLLDGTIRYLEALGHHFSFFDPLLSRNLFSSLIDVHLRAMGKCISILGKAAVLASHEIGSIAKMLQSETVSRESELPHLDHGSYCLNVIEARLRSSFARFVKTPLELHLLSAVQALERALVGAQKGWHIIYEVNVGNHYGGKVSSVVAAGIDFLDLILESVSGYRSSGILKRHMQSLIGSLFNIVAHLQSPMIFHQVKLHEDVIGSHPDPGAVILMCVEVLTKVVGKSTAYQLDACLIGQSLNLPVSLFHNFHMQNPCQIRNHSNKIVPTLFDRHYSVELYAACCRLLSSTVRHRKRETVKCICLLEGSVDVLLACLESVDADNGKRCFNWETQDAVMCASFLRRVYEEIRQQKDLLARYATYFLSHYISISSGFGPLKSGFKREVDEALRPGIYAVIDICSSDDLQLLHTVLEDGSCRRSLATLQQDYKLNFQYEGKI